MNFIASLLSFTDVIFKETSVKAVGNMVVWSPLFSKWNAMQGKIRAGTRGGSVFFPEMPVNAEEDESFLESSAAFSGLWTVVIYLSCLLLLVPFDVFLIWCMEKNSMRQCSYRLRIKNFNLKRDLIVFFFLFWKFAPFERYSYSEVISLICPTLCFLSST